MKDNMNVLPAKAELMSAAQNGGTMQQMKTSYSTAVMVQKPRDLDNIVTAVKKEAEYAGENFYYGWGEGKNRVEGVSVGLALCVAREWGNCAVETELEETKDAYIFTGFFIDLENGFTISRKYRQSKKHKVYGKMDEERKADVRFQIGQSKATRNVISAAMPKWLMEEAKNIAKQAVVDGITREGLTVAIDKSFGFLTKHGINEERILAKIGKKRNEIISEDVADIRTACAAINNGEATATECFPEIKTEKPKATKPVPPKKAETAPNVKKEDAPPMLVCQKRDGDSMLLAFCITDCKESCEARDSHMAKPYIDEIDSQEKDVLDAWSELKQDDISKQPDGVQAIIWDHFNKKSTASNSKLSIDI